MFAVAVLAACVFTNAVVFAEELVRFESTPFRQFNSAAFGTRARRNPESCSRYN